MNGGQLEQRLLVLVTLALVAFGLVMVYSATSAAAALGEGDPMTYLKRQSIYAVIGVILMIALSRFDNRRLQLLAPPLVLGSLVLCAALLVVAPEVNGARRWFYLGPASFQPSELAKLALLLATAAYIARKGVPRTLGELWNPIGLIACMFAGLFLLQPDLGTTISLMLMLARDARRRRRAGSRPRDRGSARARCRTWPRSGSSPTGESASSASSTRGPTRRTPASRPSRRSSASAPAVSRARGSARASRRSTTSPRRTRT